MMNGRSVRSVLIRHRDQNGQTEDRIPPPIQFDESSGEYRCFCNCFHVKTGTFLIGGVHIAMLLFFFIHSLSIYFQHDFRYQKRAGVHDNYVYWTFIAEMVGLSLGSVAVFLLFIGLTRNTAILLVPHIVVQCVSILCFALLLVSGAIAISTDSSVFYRLLNAASFQEHPNRSTVALDAGTLVHIYAIIVIYALSLVLEIWWVVVVYNCNRYLDERSSYMQYCLAFSTPMKTLSAR